MTKPVRCIRIEGEIAYVPLTQGFEAIIDAEDVPIVSVLNWYSRVDKRTIYARHRQQMIDGKRQQISMHRMIVSAPEGMEVDHIDGNGLNNRRSNLRISTKNQNQHNQRTRLDNNSGFKGVHWHGRDKKWCASIRKNGKSTHLGAFSDIVDAANAYSKASALSHGEFGRSK